MLRRRRPPEPPAPRPVVPTSWQEVAHILATTDGFKAEECPPLCRRKGAHKHLRHPSGGAAIIIYPVTAP